MNTTTESGWYWAKYDGEWEVVWFDGFVGVKRTFFPNQYFYHSEFSEWGNRVERKEVGK